MSSATFDSHDWSAWYFQKMNRKETQEKLMGVRHGVFLVRDSSTSKGDYVLSVSENGKVSHYIIKNDSVTKRLQIGDMDFASLPELLEFYKMHYLDTTTLIEPCARPVAPAPVQPTSSEAASPPAPSPAQPQEVYITLYVFDGKDAEDLPFGKNELLVLVKKEEDQWWLMKNRDGRVGLVPTPYIQRHDPSQQQQAPAAPLSPPQQPQQSPPQDSGRSSDYSVPPDHRPAVNTPVKALVIQDRVPNAYDDSALRLKKGDTITVLEQKLDGQWRGRLSSGKEGMFPFTHVKVLDGGEEATDVNGADPRWH